ncbi:MAG: aldehyde dehydrogenase [Gorillibacterium sp.]|nr:aldehyde dehydrogenase [Gorillibacterium sp.]
MSKTNLYSQVIQAQREFFTSGQTRSIEWRLRTLGKLKQVLKQHEGEILEALKQDLNKSEHEAYMTEVGIIYQEIDYTRKHLRRWAKPRRVRTAITHLGSTGLILSEPFGTVLIIAPWNYPFQLALSPLIGAIAAGNTVVLKPSELTPTISSLLSTLIIEAFKPEHVVAIEGGVDVSTELLKLRFDYIFFTGSVSVGKVVMLAAAQYLTPVTLELGGKSPCIVHRDANLPIAARRIAFGKFTNAGQTCIAPDYLLVHREIKEQLVDELRKVIQHFYGEQPIASPLYGKIVSKRHYDRLIGFLQDGRTIVGGESDPERLKLAPTILEGVSWDSPVMQEEIFGPILPILVYDQIEEAVTQIAEHEKPLALYLFAQDKSVQKTITEQISFGGGCVNDTLMHIATPHLPFGGVGESGMGSYHGRRSFQTFSHEKSVLKQTNWFDLAFRYPSSKGGLRIIRRFMK